MGVQLGVDRPWIVGAVYCVVRVVVAAFLVLQGRDYWRQWKEGRTWMGTTVVAGFPHEVLVVLLVTLLIGSISFIMLAILDPGEVRVGDAVRATLDWQWCLICCTPVPPRSAHCFHCFRCVENPLHHCIVISRCVTPRTFPFFFLLLMCPLAFGAVNLLYLPFQCEVMCSHHVNCRLPCDTLEIL